MMWNPARKNQSTHLPKFPGVSSPAQNVMVSGLVPPTPSPSSGAWPRSATPSARPRPPRRRPGESAGAAADVDSAGGLAGGARSEGDGLVKISGFQETFGFQHEDGPNIQVKIK